MRKIIKNVVKKVAILIMKDVCIRLILNLQRGLIMNVNQNINKLLYALKQKGQIYKINSFKFYSEKNDKYSKNIKF